MTDPDDRAKNWRPSWLETLQVYLEPATLRLLLLGFSAGLPLLLVLGTLSFWLREAGIDRTTIGYLSWVGLAYAFKWLWAPLVDRLPIPFLTARLGRRRSWLLLSQFAILIGLVAMSFNDPQRALTPVVWGALAVAFGSATQDIALDAYRIESADASRQAALAAAYQTGYRLAMIWAGAGVLWIAARAAGPGTGRLSTRCLANRLPGDGRQHAAGAWSPCCCRRNQPAADDSCPPKTRLIGCTARLVAPFADFSAALPTGRRC
jgi:PAT family beta-lactamase induction signal transducer AmpG